MNLATLSRISILSTLLILLNISFSTNYLWSQQINYKAEVSSTIQTFKDYTNPSISLVQGNSQLIPSVLGSYATNNPGWQGSAQSSLFSPNGSVSQIRAWCIEQFDGSGGATDIFDFAEYNRIHGPETMRKIASVFDALNDPAYTEGDALYFSIGIAIWMITDGLIPMSDPDALTIYANVQNGTYKPQAFVVLHARNGSFQDYVVPLQLINTIPDVTQDLGDLPDSFDTLSSTGGPHHTVVQDLFLGSCVTAENDGHPDQRGGGLAGLDGLAGDDQDFGSDSQGICTGRDDEDGIKLLTPLVPGHEACLAVSAENGLGTANLYGWIDYNGDGDFDGDANEQLNGADFTGGNASFSGNLTESSFCFDVPSSATFIGGETHMRFRLTTDTISSASPWGGSASNGEVEDYYHPLACVGNLVWLDDGLGGGIPENGIQDGSEAGISGVDVQLEWAGPDGNIINSSDNRTYTTSTASNGSYSFCGLRSAEELINSTPQATSVSNTTTGTIPAGCSSTASKLVRTFEVTDSYIVESVGLGIKASHPSRGRFVSNIQSPSGTIVSLSGMSPADTGQNVNVCFDDASSNLMNSGIDDNTSAGMCSRQVSPVNPLSNFDGENALGTWTMTVCDTQISSGNFLEAELNISGSAQSVSAGGSGTYRVSVPEGPGVAPLVSPNDATGDQFDSDGMVDGLGSLAPAFTILPASYVTPTDGDSYMSLPLSESGFEDAPGSLNGYPDSRDDLTFDFGFYNSQLPVEMGRFEAEASHAGIHVEWETLSESNNAGFSLELSSHGSPFQEAGFIEGAGSSEESRQYSFDIEGLLSGVHRLRLKQTDYDGIFAYTNEIEIDLDFEKTFEWEAAYPNPFNPSSSISFSVSETVDVSMLLYDLEGRVVKELYSGITRAGGVQKVSIEASNLPSGTYIVRVQGADFSASQPVVLLK